MKHLTTLVLGLAILIAGIGSVPSHAATSHGVARAYWYEVLTTYGPRGHVRAVNQHGHPIYRAPSSALTYRVLKNGWASKARTGWVQRTVKWPVYAPTCYVSPRFGFMVTRWASLICAYRLSLAPDLVAAVIAQESGGNPMAGSSAGAEGLMQLLPGTACGEGICGNLYDPATSIHAGTAYLSTLLAIYAHGDIRTALAMYNGGPGNPQYWYADSVLAR